MPKTVEQLETELTEITTRLAEVQAALTTALAQLEAMGKTSRSSAALADLASNLRTLQAEQASLAARLSAPTPPPEPAPAPAPDPAPEPAPVPPPRRPQTRWL